MAQCYLNKAGGTNQSYETIRIVAVGAYVTTELYNSKSNTIETTTLDTISQPIIKTSEFFEYELYVVSGVGFRCKVRAIKAGNFYVNGVIKSCIAGEQIIDTVSNAHASVVGTAT